MDAHVEFADPTLQSRLSEEQRAMARKVAASEANRRAALLARADASAAAKRAEREAEARAASLERAACFQAPGSDYGHATAPCGRAVVSETQAAQLGVVEAAADSRGLEVHGEVQRKADTQEGRLPSVS